MLDRCGSVTLTDFTLLSGMRPLPRVELPQILTETSALFLAKCGAYFGVALVRQV